MNFLNNCILLNHVSIQGPHTVHKSDLHHPGVDTRNIFKTATQPLITNTYLKDGKVFKNAVHHVLFRQVLQFVYKIDHVFAHWRPLDFVNKTTTFTFGKFRFKFFNNLFTKATYFGGALNCHVFITLIPENIHKNLILLRFRICQLKSREYQ